MMPVVPMVPYHGKRPWRPEDFWSCFKALPIDISGYIPNFDYVFMDLSCYTDKQLKAGAFKAAAVKIGLLIMKRIYDQDNLEKALREYIEIGRQYFTTPTGLEFLRSVIQYLFQVTDIGESTMAAAIAPAVENGGDEVMTTAQKLREEGFTIGCQKGWQDVRQKGCQEGSQHLLSNLVMGMRKRGLDAAQIAENLGLNPTLVTRVINRESVEIPLYLLEQDKDKPLPGLPLVVPLLISHRPRSWPEDRVDFASLFDGPVDVLKEPMCLIIVLSCMI